MRPSVERSCSISHPFLFVNTFLQNSSTFFEVFLNFFKMFCFTLFHASKAIIPVCFKDFLCKKLLSFFETFSVLCIFSLKFLLIFLKYFLNFLKNKAESKISVTIEKAKKISFKINLRMILRPRGEGQSLQYEFAQLFCFLNSRTSSELYIQHLSDSLDSEYITITPFSLSYLPSLSVITQSFMS